MSCSSTCPACPRSIGAASVSREITTGHRPVALAARGMLVGGSSGKGIHPRLAAGWCLDRSSSEPFLERSLPGNPSTKQTRPGRCRGRDCWIDSIRKQSDQPAARASLRRFMIWRLNRPPIPIAAATMLPGSGTEIAAPRKPIGPVPSPTVALGGAPSRNSPVLVEFHVLIWGETAEVAMEQEHAPGIAAHELSLRRRRRRPEGQPPPWPPARGPPGGGGRPQLAPLCRPRRRRQLTTFRGGFPSSTRRMFVLPLIRMSSSPSSE